MNPTIHEAAILLNGSESWTRSLCQRQLIGDAWGNGHFRKTYVIVPGRLADFMKISEAELERRLKGVRDGIQTV